MIYSHLLRTIRLSLCLRYTFVIVGFEAAIGFPMFLPHFQHC